MFGRGAAGLGIALATVALAAALMWSFSAAGLAEDASRLDSVDLALGSAAVTRATTTQAVLVAVNHSHGDATDEALSAAVGEAASNVAALNQLTLQLPSGSEVALFTDATTAIIDLLRNSNVEEARSRVADLDGAYGRAVDVLSSERADAVVALNSAATLAGRLSQALRVTTVVAIPLLTMLIMSSWHRRRRRNERADFLAALDEAAAGEAESDSMLLDASHRFRTPLTSIYGLAEVLVQSKNVSRLERELISLVHAEAADLYRIADDVLVATQDRIGSLEATAEILSLSETADDAVKPIRATGIDVKVDCPDVWVLSDPSKVRQIIRNIVANAAKHGAEPIFVEVSETDGRVECVVVDHGDGVPEPFDPQSGLFPSGGRGLSMAYLLSDLIGAHLEYRRDADQTRFILSFSEDGQAEGPQRPMAALPRPITADETTADESIADESAAGESIADGESTGDETADEIADGSEEMAAEGDEAE